MFKPALYINGHKWASAVGLTNISLCVLPVHLQTMHHSSFFFLTIKCYSFRNRLESNAEHWSALLLSLRELTEWVIRKETELTALAPPRGDLAALLKQQVMKNERLNDLCVNKE